MKIIYAVIVVLTLMALLLPAAVAGSVRANDAPPENAAPAVSDAPPAAAASAAPSADPEAHDAACSVAVLEGSESVIMPLDDYLVGVVAAEMPASFEPEALRAQAIVARTYCAYRCSGDTHGGGICTDPSCCEAFADDSELRTRWGAGYAVYIEKIRSAVRDTDGLVLTWEGAPILAAYHSSSRGSTEDCAEVWSAALPYLVSVSTPETAEDVRGFDQTLEFSAAAFKNTVLAAYPDAVFVTGPEGWLTEPAYTAAGRLKSVRVGGVVLTGAQLRLLFGLRSTALIWEAADAGGIAFTSSGYGHGVGMSQYGANVMAKAGSDAGDILSHYYPGAKLEQSIEITKVLV